MYQVVIFTGSGSRSPNKSQGSIRAIGAYRIATELRKHGYTVKVLDYTIQLSKDPEYYSKVFNKYVSKETIWVGISSTFLEDPDTNILLDKLVFTNELLLEIKSKYPRLKIVYGGSRAYKKITGVDIFVEGYADTTVVELTKALDNKLSSIQYDRSTGEARVTYDKKAASFDFCNSKSDFTIEDYVHHGASLPIEIARGCIFQCSFCSYPLNGKKKKDYLRNFDILREELEFNYAHYGVTTYSLSDDTFNDYTEKLELLYEHVVRKLTFKLKFVCYLRLDLIQAHPEQIDLLKNLGIRGAFFGIESLTQQAATAVKKGGNTSAKLEFVHRLKEEWPETLLTGGFIIGLPYDTKEKLSEWVPSIYDESSPFDSVTLYPLGIDFNKSKVWKSDIELNPSKYGYEKHPEFGWYNKFSDLTHKDATSIWKYHNEKIETSRNHFYAHCYARWSNLGYPHEEILSGNRLENCKFSDSNIRWEKILSDYKYNILK